MKKVGVEILLLLLCASIALGMQNATGLTKYTSPKGHYTVLLPAQPTLVTQEATAGTGKKFPQYVALVVEPGDVAYLVAYYNRVPGNVFSFDAAIYQVVEALQATVTNETSISLDGREGREVRLLTTVANGTDYLVRARVYDFGKRVYVVQFIIPKSADGALNDAKAAKYFDSFQVVKK